MKIAHPGHDRGFMLFEALIAITIFSISVTGIVLALNTSTELIRTIEREGWIQSKFKDILTEALKAKQTKVEFLQEKVITLEEFGASALVVISPAELENEDGLLLPNLYDVKISLSWIDGIEEKDATLSTVHYFPLYQN